MKVGMEELVQLSRVAAAIHEKNAAEAEDKNKEEEAERKRKAKEKSKKQRPKLTDAYPDYGRSIVSQQRKDPVRAGLRRGTGSATLGAILGALLARTASSDPRVVGAGAVGGGLLGGIPGYISGSEEAKSDYTKLLALRRLGIQTPNEYESSMKFPGLAEYLTQEGVRI